MSKKPTARKQSRPPERRPAAATSAQIMRQLAVVVVVVAIWSALLVGYLALTRPAQEPASTPQPTAAETVPALEATAASEQVGFAADVLPIFEANCQRCHGTTRTDAGLSLSSYAGVMAGASGNPVVVPGSADTSLLVQQITTGRMPRGGSKLSDADIQTISDWVNAGAPDNYSTLARVATGPSSLAVCGQ